MLMSHTKRTESNAEYNSVSCLRVKATQVCGVYVIEIHYLNTGTRVSKHNSLFNKQIVGNM